MSAAPCASRNFASTGAGAARISRFLGLLAFFALIPTTQTDAVETSATRETVIQLGDLAGAGKALHAIVNGHAAVFLFDSGEGISTITPRFAKEIGCQPWGQITGFRMSGERMDFARCDGLQFDIDGTTLDAPTAGVFDINSLLPASEAVLAGSLGLDIFVGKQITLEPAANRIIIESPASFARRTEHAQEVPARVVRDSEGVALAVDVGVPTKSGMAWMELDTGNGGTLVIARHVARLLGLDPDKREPQRANFHLAGEISVEGPARVRDLIMDGNIGQHFLRNWNVTLDLAAGRVWMAPVAAP